MSTEVVKTDSAAIATGAPVQFGELSRQQVELLKDTICKGATDDELRLFVEVCKRKRLDPFSKQIHPVKRWDSTLKREVMSYQTGIDGFRVIGERGQGYAGQDGPYWCGKDGDWKDVWLSNDPPMAAKVGIFRSGFAKPIYGIAIYREYVQVTRDGGPNSMWQKMPASQLAKCAESLAWRKAFPEDLSGIYTHDEMGQADVEPPTPPPAPRQQPQTQQAPQGSGQQKKASEQVVDVKPAVDFSDDKAFRDACVAVYRRIGNTDIFNSEIAAFGGKKPAEVPAENRVACHARLLEVAGQMEADEEERAGMREAA